ncbi:carbohydrate-binding protein, partial [Streptomyces sp. NPDC026672]
MRSSSYSVLSVRGLRAAVVFALTAGLATAVPAAAHAESATAAKPATSAKAPVAAKPYMGWSSWSMQSSKYPGLNPDGDYSYLTEANVLKQTDALASKLKRFGYEYVNIDAGWWRDNAWKPEFD